MIIVFASVLALVWLKSQEVPVTDNTLKPNQQTLPTITPRGAWPTLSNLEQTPIVAIPETTKQQLIKQLPFETPNFLVEYLAKANKFYVTIKAPDHQTNYEQAIVWLTQQQVPNPPNNSQIRFVYLKNWIG